MAFDGFPTGRKTRPEDLARVILVSFLLTFITARTLVILIMTRPRFPDLYLYLGGTHVHHLNYGIFLLSAVGGYVILRRPVGARLRGTALAYGVGLALTFDEFGMWFNLGGLYWQRASYDAVVVILGLLLLIVVAPVVSRFRSGNWILTVLLALAVVAFGYLLISSMSSIGRRVLPRLQQIEADAPR